MPPCRMELSDDKVRHESAFLRIERRILSAFLFGRRRVEVKPLPSVLMKVWLHFVAGILGG